MLKKSEQVIGEGRSADRHCNRSRQNYPDVRDRYILRSIKKTKVIKGRGEWEIVQLP